MNLTLLVSTPNGELMVTAHPSPSRSAQSVRISDEKDIGISLSRKLLTSEH
jgi:hypothetical protein